jgi:hypothetical protein
MNRLFGTALILLVLLGCLAPGNVQAVAGAPGSPDFGFGAWLHPDGKYFQEGLNSLTDLPLDWVAVNLDWAKWMPDPGKTPDVSALDGVMQGAAGSEIAVMISLSNPPSWAVTEQGPDSIVTSQTLVFLATRYSGILKAVELFPSANTFEGWQATPDAVAYTRMYSDVKISLQSQGINIILVAGGLHPVGLTTEHELNDLDFLRGIYAAGAAQWIDVIGLHLNNLTGNPLNASQGGMGFGLRHYEAVRQVMLENDHQSGLIWITQLCLPDGTINSGDKVYQSSQRQAEWLQQTAIQIRSQLYIGVVFIQNINPASPSDLEFGKTALILNPDSFHPFYSVLKAVIQQTHPEAQEQSSGRPKSNSLLKCKYKT